jgi:hypothetical protein
MQKFNVVVKRIVTTTEHCPLEVEATSAYAARSKALERYYKDGSKLKWVDSSTETTPRVEKVEKVNGQQE